MSNDDYNNKVPRRARGDTNKPSRDARGRWRSGCKSPNPKGRPKKRPMVKRDQSDIRIFGNTIVDVIANGKIETMDRREALLNKIYEGAMKGKVTSQRFLFKEFAKNDELMADICVQYEQIMMQWIVNNHGQNRVEVPIEIERRIIKLRYILNYHFPGDYPINGRSNDEDEQEEEE
jgi:hypothetical protein